MSKMFKCEDGTMFLIDEVLSVEEATTYYDKRGHRIKPVQIYSSEKEMIDAIPNIVSHPHGPSTLAEIGSGIDSLVDIVFEVPIACVMTVGSFLLWLIFWVLCFPFRYFFGTKFPRSYSRSCFCPFLSKKECEIADRKQREQQIKTDAEMLDNCRKSCYEAGLCFDINRNCYALKQWNVTLRTKQKKIHIFNSDYEKLRAEMGN